MKTASDVCLAIEQAPNTDALIAIWREVVPLSTAYTMDELAQILDAIQRRSVATPEEPRTDS